MDTITNISAGILLVIVAFTFLSAVLSRHVYILRFLKLIAFAVYLVMNLYETILFRPHYPSMHYELELFWSYKRALQGNTFYTRQIVLNILLYVPYGFLVPDIWRRMGFKKVFLAGFLLSLATELTQLLFKIGLFELDDIFNNTLGCVVGYLLFVISAELAGREKK